MTNLSQKQTKIYQTAVHFGHMHGYSERGSVESLIAVERERVHKALGHRSMLLFTQKEMKLSRPTGLMLIAVARSAAKFPALREAIKNKKLSATKASRVVAHLTPENVEEIIEYAATHTYNEIDFEMARRNPRAAAKDSAKPISEDLVELRATVTKSAYSNIERSRSLLARKGRPSSISAVIEASVETFVEKYDPVRKASRAKGRKVCVHRPNQRITQAQKNARLAFDQGRCTHIDADGERCNCDWFVEVHHVVRPSDGGTNDIENLRTLCWYHHDLAHQLDFDVQSYRNNSKPPPT